MYFKMKKRQAKKIIKNRSKLNYKGKTIKKARVTYFKKKIISRM